MKILNKKEIKKFTKKYLPMWKNDILEVSMIKYGRIKEYLVNKHFIVLVKGYKVIKKDLQ